MAGAHVGLYGIASDSGHPHSVGSGPEPRSALVPLLSYTATSASIDKAAVAAAISGLGRFHDADIGSLLCPGLRGEGSGLVPQPPAPMTAPPPALLEPPASLVEQMMRTKAPVIRNPPCASSCGAGAAGTTADYGVLLPLTGAGQEVMGALWITRPAAGSSLGGAPPALLQRPAALQQLGLCVSALLLASAQDCQHMAAVSEGLHALASAASVQQLLAALGGAVERHVRQRYLLAPRVVTALVPERGAETGLFLGWSDAADAQPPSMPGTPPRQRRAVASASFRRLSRAATASAIPTETEGGLTAPAAPGGSRPVARSTSSHAPVTVALAGSPAGGPSALVASGSRQDMARAAARNVRMTTMMRAASSLTGPETQKDTLPARDSQRQANLTTSPGYGAGFADGSDCGGAAASAPCNVLSPAPSLLPLSPLALAALEAAGAAAAMGPALRAKPFTLAQTLLRQLLTSASEPGAAASEGDGGGGASAASPGGLRPQALAVEDGVSLLQDPKQPSRDILLLLAGAGQQARAKPGSPARAFGRSVADNAEGSLGASGGALAVRSLLLLTLPAGPGSGGAALGLYVVFPQRLPMALLAEARASLLELGEMAAPAVYQKLDQDLAFELKTIATAAPGLYAVTPSGQQPFSGTIAAAEPASGRAAGPASGAWVADTSSQSPLGSQAYRRRPADVAADWLLPEAAVSTAAVKMALQDAGGSRSAAGSGDGEADGVDFSIDSLPNNAVSSAVLIQVESLTTDTSTLRSQMPLLVASLQGSINNARAEASVAAAAAAASARTSSESAAAGHGGSARVTGHLGSQGGINTAGNSDLARIELISQLGFGGCAVVFKARMGPLDVAVKLMEMPDVDGRGRFGEEYSSAVGDAAPSEQQVEKTQLEARRTLLRNAMEVAAMTSLSGHPNVMALYEAHSNVVLMRKDLPDGNARLRLQNASETTESNIPGGSPLCVALVCEWCDRGCLASMLVDMRNRVREQNLAAAAQQPAARPALNHKFILMTLLDVAMALRHLHSHNLIHRDLKPANVLLSSSHTDPRGFVAKLADFGFVTILDQPGDEESGGHPWTLAKEMCGTITYMAPEGLRKPARLGPSCDVFSFGILMWEMTAIGSRPYPEVPLNNITTYVKVGGRPRFLSSIPPAYRRLAAQCWEADPLKRPTAAALVAATSSMLEDML
ncbi:hypothetical protein HYH03_005835 [Edaphochlamys debaryana]|uniref:Protein kinase domain-containing protein n=1 Tax=Edaphochlamys debaryana TaxID=47281 RepID=A0A835Y716_9CHLO|nr:hypothetical protein HYH03_005835 [Edaphochlamys debaryana]|eukprot:KAG2496237.1 hypothetical protein HYH03_005835 [Edaphochlamys debaryana]